MSRAQERARLLSEAIRYARDNGCTCRVEFDVVDRGGFAVAAMTPLHADDCALVLDDVDES